MSRSIRVVALLHSTAGEEEAVEAAVLACVASSRAENGNLSYIATRDQKDPALFVVIEHWADSEARGRHLQSEHFKELGRQVDDAGRLNRHTFHVLSEIG